MKICIMIRFFQICLNPGGKTEKKGNDNVSIHLNEKVILFIIGKSPFINCGTGDPYKCIFKGFPTVIPQGQIN